MTKEKVSAGVTWSSVVHNADMQMHEALNLGALVPTRLDCDCTLTSVCNAQAARMLTRQLWVLLPAW